MRLGLINIQALVGGIRPDPGYLLRQPFRSRAYLEYRDTWLDRLRQFTTAESQVKDLRSIGANVTVPGWLDRDESSPG